MLRLFGSLTTPTFWPLVVMLTHHAHSNFSSIIKLTHNSKKFNKILVSRAKLPELLLFRNYGFYSNQYKLYQGKCGQNLCLINSLAFAYTGHHLVTSLFCTTTLTSRVNPTRAKFKSPSGALHLVIRRLATESLRHKYLSPTQDTRLVKGQTFPQPSTPSRLQ